MMMEELLQFEGNSNILDFKFNFNDELIWPFFRVIVFQNIIHKISDNKPQFIHKNEKENKLYNYIIKNPYLQKNRKILFFYGNTSNVLDENGMYFNRLYDYYSNVYEKDTLMIESKFFQEHQKPRKFTNVLYEDFINRIVEINKNLEKYNHSDLNTAESFISYLQHNLPYSLEKGFFEGLKKQVLDLSIKLKYFYYYYNSLIKNINPKIIFFEDGCYGSKSYIIKLSNELGITTAEFQHGYVGYQHPAYNYSLTMKNIEEYKKYMPKYYLTFGEFWNENIRLPIETKVIGSPHFYNNLNKFYKSNLNKISNLKCYKNILIVSGANCYKDYINLIENIAPKLNGKYKIILRLHPLERNSKKNYDCLKKFNNVIINDDGDLYEYISISEYIIGDSSTAIYEAVGFSKKILIFENNDSLLYTSKDFGTWFKTSEELYDLLINDERVKTINNIKYYWDDKWEENYINFVNDVTGGLNE